MAAFIATSQLSLQAGFENILNVASQEKAILQSWATKLSGNITGIDAMNMAANLAQVIPSMTTAASLPGMEYYAQTQYGNPSYDIVGAFNGMISALQAVQSWLVVNVPSNAVSLSAGILVGSVYTPAQTATLLTLVNAAAATIN